MDILKMPCSICDGRRKALYTCPRCGVRYCSVACYRHEQHAACSEEFYRRCVLDELKDCSVRDAEKKSMMEILLRQHEETAIEADEAAVADAGDDLEQRLRGCDLESADSEFLWKQLSDAERQDFLRMVREGQLSALVPPWIPWWTLRRSPKPLVREMGACDDRTERPVTATEQSEQQPHLPPLPKRIIPFAELTAKAPPPCLVFNLVNVLYAYVYVLRRYNGDHSSLAVSIIEDVVSISEVLDSAANFPSVQDALLGAMARLRRLSDLYESPDHCATVVEDVVMLLDGPEPNQHSAEYVLRALSDLESIVKEALKDLPASETGDESNKRRLLALKKKLRFYLSWSASHCHHLTAVIHDVIRVAETSRLSPNDSQEPVGSTVDANTTRKDPQPLPKLLVQEL